MIFKTIFHIDETNKWRLVINNIKNLQKDEADYTIEILANSEAVTEFIYGKSAYGKELRQLSESCVRICACQNSLKGNNIEKKEIFDFIEIVPIGVKELIQKQQEGYAYIKP